MYRPNFGVLAGVRLEDGEVDWMSMRTLNTSRFVPPLKCVGRVGGSLEWQDLAARHIRWKITDAIVE